MTVLGVNNQKQPHTSEEFLPPGRGGGEKRLRENWEQLSDNRARSAGEGRGNHLTLPAG